MGPLVLIHGSGLSASSWRYQLEYFPNAVAVDLPGHGASTDEALKTIAESAAWLGTQIRSTGPDPVTLVGHSMGSLIALEAAALNPDMVAGLVLIGTSADMRVNRDLLAAARKRDPEAGAMVIKWSLPGSAGYGRPKEWVLDMSNDYITSAENGVLAADLAACDEYRDAVAMADRVRCPALLILGEKDVMTKPAAAQPIAAALSDARIVVVANAGHMMPMDRPDEVNEAIGRFLTTD